MPNNYRDNCVVPGQPRENRLSDISKLFMRSRYSRGCGPLEIGASQTEEYNRLGQEKKPLNDS